MKGRESREGRKDRENREERKGREDSRKEREDRKSRVEREGREDRTEYNMTFGILSGLAIVMVVAGHLGYNILTVGDLFPYYSFHVPLFLFISGYFYRKGEQERPLAYIVKKAKRLLLPYFVWNVVYGLLAWLLRGNGFAMGEEISPVTLFVAPFMHGYQFIYNYAAWFVPVLFVIEMMNLLMRLAGDRMSGIFARIGGRTHAPDEQRWERNREWVYLTGSLAVGMTVVYLAIGGHVWGNYKAPGRILFLYPCFQMGQFYKKNLERHDGVKNLPYFAVVLSVQTALHVLCNGLAFSSVWCTGFVNGPLIPYVTIVTGIAFWLRIARILSSLAGTGGAVRWFGRHTFTVMMHHVMVFMLIKMILAGIAAGTGALADFDFGQFYSNIDYIYLVNGAEHFKMVYLAAGVGVPLGLRCLTERVRKAGTGKAVKERREEKALKKKC